MKLHAKAGALLAFFSLQHLYVGADDVNNMISSLESLKETASSMIEEISQRESELMEGELLSERESEFTNEDLDPKNIDYIFEEMDEDAEPDVELEKEFDFGLNGTITYSLAREILDSIPDKGVNRKVHALIKRGKYKEAEDAVHNFFDSYVLGLDHKDAKTMNIQKPAIFAALDHVIEHYEDNEYEREELTVTDQADIDYIFEEMEEDAEPDVELEKESDSLFELNGTITYSLAREMLDSIPDKGVNRKVHALIKRGKYKEAEDAVHNFFDSYVSGLDQKDAKTMNEQKPAIFAALDHVIEHYEDNEYEREELTVTDQADETFEEMNKEKYIDDSETDASSDFYFEEDQSQFDQIIRTLPDEEVRNNIMERIEEGNIDEAETEFKAFVNSYMSDLPDGEKEKAKGTNSELMEYITLQFQNMRDAENISDLDKAGSKNNKQDGFAEVLSEIAENQKLIGEVLQALENGN